jgi:hypothetical protein
VARPRRLPSDYVIFRQIRLGFTHGQIANKYGVGRTAVATAMSRAGLTEPKRYREVIPWRVRMRHQDSYDLRMLRAYARIQAGDVTLDPVERHRCELWCARLEVSRVVVGYDEERQEGFYRVDKRPGIDTSVIRAVPQPARPVS